MKIHLIMIAAATVLLTGCPHHHKPNAALIEQTQCQQEKLIEHQCAFNQPQNVATLNG